jgi:RAD51-like protein 1
MELLDVPMEALLSAVTFISQKVCPPCHSVLDIMKERAKTEPAYGHLPTGLQGLDGALWGGIPFGIVTEVVGPAGIGKTQLCLMLSALTSMPEALGGLNSGVIYIDTEHKFTSGRLIEIAHSLSPEVLGDNLLQQVHKFQGLPNCYCEQKCVDEMCLRS